MLTNGNLAFNAETDETTFGCVEIYIKDTHGFMYSEKSECRDLEGTMGSAMKKTALLFFQY